jgi:chromosome partitioning protein
MRVISITAQKGGVGKTTTAVNLAAALGEAGERVLVIDLDSQASATGWLGQQAGDGLLGVFTDEVPLETLVVDTPAVGVACVAASRGLANLERVLAGEPGSETLLRMAIDDLPRTRWTYVLLDCPPAMGLVTLNALTAAREVIAPVETKTMALEGLTALLTTVARVRKRLNRHLRVAAIVPSRVVRTRLSREVQEALREHFGDLVTETFVRENARLAEAPSYRLPITSYASTSYGAEDFRSLAEEIRLRAREV